jgi:TRAP transporter TAXI family solute receptor
MTSKRRTLRAPWRTAIAVAGLLGLCRCGPAPAAAPPVSLTLATGGQGGAFYQLGAALSMLYTERLPGVTARFEPGGSGPNLDALEQGRVQIAFAQADVAYAAYRRGTGPTPQPHTSLRGIAVLWMNTVQLAVPRSSAVRTWRDLKGRVVSVGAKGGGSETLARIVLESYGLGEHDLTLEFAGFQPTMAGLRTGAIDAAILSAGIPTAALSEFSQGPGLRLVPIPHDQVRTMRAQYPFLQPLIVPAGTYMGVDDDVETVGVSVLMACRRDLDEELVYRLTKLLFSELPAIGETVSAALLIDSEQAPTTPIPLHPGAARYYREREITQ